MFPICAAEHSSSSADYFTPTVPVLPPQAPLHSSCPSDPLLLPTLTAWVKWSLWRKHRDHQGETVRGGKHSQAAEEKATNQPLIISINGRGRYFILDLLLADTDDMPIISCIPNNYLCNNYYFFIFSLGTKCSWTWDALWPFVAFRCISARALWVLQDQQCNFSVHSQKCQYLSVQCWHNILYGKRTWNLSRFKDRFGLFQVYLNTIFKCQMYDDKVI